LDENDPEAALRAGAYASGLGSTICTACPSAQVTGTLGATASGACAAPPAVPPFNATLFDAAGSCAAALTLFNSLYNSNLTIAQQVGILCESFALRIHGSVMPLGVAGMRMLRNMLAAGGAAATDSACLLLLWIASQAGRRAFTPSVAGAHSHGRRAVQPECPSIVSMIT
jgi:hypothetical protein